MADRLCREEGQTRRRLAGLVLGRVGNDDDGGGSNPAPDLEIEWRPDGPTACEDWLPLPPQGDTDAVDGWARRDGRRVLIAASVPSPEKEDRLLRRAVPFAAGLQGRPMLHASAVADAERAFAFVGESGVGKSTLARLLVSRGFEPLADDLIQVRGLLEARPSLPAIYFPRRTGPPALLGIRPLAGREFLSELLRHGFSEMVSPELWRHQFEAYGRLAEEASGFLLDVPEGLPAQISGVDRLVAILERT